VLGYDGDFDLTLLDIENCIGIIALRKITSFFECLEMSRPMAVVAKNTAGSNSGAPPVLPFLLRLMGLDLGA
jgi:hypothetical protein